MPPYAGLPPCRSPSNGFRCKHNGVHTQDTRAPAAGRSFPLKVLDDVVLVHYSLPLVPWFLGWWWWGSRWLAGSGRLWEADQKARRFRCGSSSGFTAALALVAICWCLTRLTASFVSPTWHARREEKHTPRTPTPPGTATSLDCLCSLLCAASIPGKSRGPARAFESFSQSVCAPSRKTTRYISSPQAH